MASTAFAFSAYRTADAATKNAERAARDAEEQRKLALTATADAQNQKFIAVIQKENAVKSSAEADAQKLVAVKEKENAVKAAKEAQAQKRIADNQREAALMATARAVEERHKALASQRRTLQFNYVANINLAHRAFDEGNRFLGGKNYSRVSCLPGICRQRIMFVILPGTVSGGSITMNHSLSKVTVKPVMSVAFSRDGEMLASGGEDGTVKLWDVRTKQELSTLKGHAATVIEPAFCPDGRTLASVSYDGTVKLWDVNAKQELRNFKGDD